MEKNEIRAQILAKRDALTTEEIEQKSRLIFEKLVNMEEYRNAENILVYASMESEVRTDDIILDALADGKKVFCPKVTDKGNALMEFVRITALEDLKEGYFGIREPEITDESELAGNAKEEDEGKYLVIMPGVAFDRDGNRIGYGGGFYDRYLAEHEISKTIALCFKVQIIDEIIKSTSEDIRPKVLISEE